MFSYLTTQDRQISRVSPFLRDIGRFGLMGLNPDWVKPMTYKIDIYGLLSWHGLLRGEVKDWWAQCHDNVTEWDIRSWGKQPDFQLEPHYKFAASVPCDKSIPILIWHEVLLGCRIQAVNQPLVFVLVQEDTPEWIKASAGLLCRKWSVWTLCESNKWLRQLILVTTEPDCHHY